MDLVLIGLNFRTAPIELREKISFQPRDIPAALQRLEATHPETELLLLSTCNRTELYIAGQSANKVKAQLVDSLLGGTDIVLEGDSLQHFYTKVDTDAANHLMAVASGLDSMVVGETEVLGQVKQAYSMAMEAKTISKVLHPVFQAALRTAKRVHTETDLCRGRVSVSSVAVEFARKVFDDLKSKTIMIVGAGETGELAFRSLVGKGAGEVLILNRSLDKAESLASKYGGRAIEFDGLEGCLPQADIVISSTSAEHCVIDLGMVKKAIAVRHSRPMLLVDIAVPRDIEEDVGTLENVYLYDIDDLQQVANENMARRQKAVGSAKQIIHEELHELAAMFDSASVESLMKHLSDYARKIEEAELQKAFEAEELSSLPESSQGAIRELVQRISHRMLAGPRNAVRRGEQDGDHETFVQTVRHLFGHSRGNRDAEQ
jgi:glutamyl-tRNA reductase